MTLLCKISYDFMQSKIYEDTMNLDQISMYLEIENLIYFKMNT